MSRDGFKDGEGNVMGEPTYDPIGVVEAGYCLDGDVEQWLRGLMDQCAPAIGEGLGIFAYTHNIDHQGSPHVVSPLQTVGTPPWVEKLVHLVFQEFPQLVAAGWRNTGMQSMLGNMDAVSPEQAAVFAQRQWDFAPPELTDCLGVNAWDPTGNGVLVAAVRRHIPKIPKREAQRWKSLTAHLAAGLRLRLALTRGQAGEEAVLQPDGRCLHAESPAKPKEAREILREAALRMDRARGRLRKEDPDEALDIYEALVHGRWSLVDRFESDGRRYLIARRNDPTVQDPRGLTQREAQVAILAAQGHNNPLIAYTLGLADSTVATHLSSAMTKLGVRSRLALLQRLSTLAGLASRKTDKDDAADD